MLVREVFSQEGPIENFEAFFEELYDRFASPDTWRPFPDTLPTLEELKKRGKILGIVSNWDSRLFGICKGLDLERYLDFVLASAVVGAAKPSPKIFEEALRQARVSPEEALHVGDSLEDDVLGAQQAGIHAVLLDRKGGRCLEAQTSSDLQFLSGMFEKEMTIEEAIS
jgi:putative hydrolase of the HAD superfamily